MKTLKLTGNTEEAFYKLGIDDRHSGKIVLNDVKNLLSTPWKPVNIAIEEIAKNLLKQTLLKDSNKFSVMKPYCEGLKIDHAEGAYSALVPEIVSCLSKWVPTLSKGVLGCSSFIGKNNKGEIIHGRLLDFPLHQTFDKFERAITYQIDDHNIIVGLGSEGIPYPSISLMTEHGITISLHQKFTDIFDQKGTPIFDYIYELASTCKTEEDVKSFISSHKTITTWCLIMSFPTGKAISVDLASDKSFIKEFSIPETGYIYFANDLNNPDYISNDFIPYHFDEFNKQRHQIVSEKLSSVSTQLSDLELLELMTTPLDKKLSNSSEFKMDNINWSTISAFVLNPTAKKITYLAGEAPKLLKDSVIELNNCFDEIEQKKLKIKKSKTVDEFRHKGQLSLMLAQKAFDQKKSIEVYHQLQMSKEYLENYSEVIIADFYFLVAQFIFEKHDQVLAKLLYEFKKKKDLLPVNLNDHCLMFIIRLEKILNLTFSVEVSEIQNENLQKIMKKELKIPNIIYRPLIKNTIAPRLDILDVIYLISA